MKLSFVLAIFFTTLLNAYTEVSFLKGVVIISRHGDRAPVTGYPSDPYKNVEWPGGLGSISPLGLREMRLSGILKRKRYASLFQEGGIYIRSSASDRCIKSAKSFLRGFLPLKYKPVRLFTPNPDEDELLIIPGKLCPAHEQSFMKSFDLNQTDVEQVLNGNRHVLDYVRKYTGLNISNLIDILNVEDTLTVQANNGFEMPTWAQPVYHTYMKPLAHIAYSRMSASAWMQVKSGALLNDIVERLEPCTIESNENIIFYSGHDLNLSALMMYLGIINRIEWRPDFSAAFVIELYKNRLLWQDYTIKFLYFRDETDELPIELTVPSCGAQCSFKAFNTIFKPKLIEDYERSCLL